MKQLQNNTFFHNSLIFDRLEAQSKNIYFSLQGAFLPDRAALSSALPPPDSNADSQQRSPQLSHSTQKTLEIA